MINEEDCSTRYCVMGYIANQLEGCPEHDPSLRQKLGMIRREISYRVYAAWRILLHGEEDY